MQILYVVLDAGLGGHTRTAAHTAVALRKRGHDIRFLIGESSNERVIVERGFEFDRVAGRFYPLVTRLGRVLRSRRPDAVHLFDQRHVAETMLACRWCGVPYFWTICGGTNVWGLLPARPLAVLSEQRKEGFVEASDFSTNDVKVIAARLNLDETLTNIGRLDAETAAAFRRRYGIGQETRIILRIARVHPVYLQVLLQCVQLALDLAREGRDVCFVNIGMVQSKESEQVLREQIAAVNEAAGRIVAVTAQAEAAEAVAFVSIAEVVTGSARSAFEGMLAGKPTLVFGRQHFAGLVEPATVDDLAYCNFFGNRNDKKDNRDESTRALLATTRRLLDEPGFAKTVGLFGKAYVEANLDADKGAEQYERLYMNRTNNELPPAIRLHKRLLRERYAKAASAWQRLTAMFG